MGLDPLVYAILCTTFVLPVKGTVTRADAGMLAPAGEEGWHPGA